MKTYLINLDRHADRLAHMRAQLNGIAFERISAVDGSNRPQTQTGLTCFELACLESHRTAWREFLRGATDFACILEDDLHVWPGLPDLVADQAWIPKDAHSVKLDTYLTKVRLGDHQTAIGGRQVARLYSRHQSSAAYLLTRSGAVRYLELTENRRLPADYSLFPANPRRAGLRIYQLVPAIAIQDHLVRFEDGGQNFATAMVKAGGDAEREPRSAGLKKLRREGCRLAGKVAGFAEWTYQRAFLRLETTTVRVG
jgi:glycosyl transferase, family 25